MGIVRNAFNLVWALNPLGLNPDKSDILGIGDVIDAQFDSIRSIVAAGAQWKTLPVALATTGNITLSGEQTIDSITTAGSDVLVKDQSVPAQNGIYTTGSGSWVRRADADTAAEMLAAAVFVKGGAINGGRAYLCSTPGPITLGATALTFALFADQSGLNTTLAGKANTADVNAALSNKLDTTVFNLASLVPSLFSNSAWINTTGDLNTTVQAGSWLCTDFLPIAYLDVSSLKLYGDPTACSIAFYDRNLVFISGVSAPATGAFVSSYPAPPTGAAFVRFTAHLPFAGQAFVYVIKTGAMRNPEENGELYLGNIFSLAHRRGYFNNASPPIVIQEPHWFHSDYIAVTPGRVVNYAFVTAPGVSNILWFDANKTFISTGVAGGSATVAINGQIIVPAGAAFMRLSYGNPGNFALAASSPAYIYYQSVQDAYPSAELFSGNLAALATLIGFISPAGVVNSTDTNWLRSDFIAIKPGRYISYDGYTTAQMNIVSFYDANKTYISGVLGTASARSTGTVQVPSTAAYMKISYGNLDGTNTLGTGGTAYSGVFFAPNFKSQTDAASGTGNADLLSGNLAALATSVGYVSPTGVATSTDTNWLRSDFIAVKPGRYIYYDGYTTNAMNIVSFYDANKAYISGVVGGQFARTTGAVQVPSTASYMKISFGNLDGTNTLTPGGTGPYAGVYFAPTFQSRATLNGLMNAPILQASDLTILYGDSRFSPTYTFNKTAFASRLGCTVLNNGISGHTVAQNASNADLANIFAAPAVPRFIIWLPGGNDTGAAGTIGTFSSSSVNGLGGEAVVVETDITVDYAGTKFIQAISHVMRKVRAQYYNIRARAALTGSETETQKGNKIRAVVRPILVVCTDIPQQRTDASNAYSVPANWERKRQAILECGAKYGVRLADTMSKVYLDMSLEPFYTLPADAVTNNGVMFMDGLHPNEFLHDRLAEFVVSETGILA